MGGNWVSSRTFSKKIGENKNVLTILPSYPIAEECRENKHGAKNKRFENRIVYHKLYIACVEIGYLLVLFARN